MKLVLIAAVLLVGASARAAESIHTCSFNSDGDQGLRLKIRDGALAEVAFINWDHSFIGEYEPVTPMRRQPAADSIAYVVTVRGELEDETHILLVKKTLLQGGDGGHEAVLDTSRDGGDWDYRCRPGD